MNPSPSPTTRDELVPPPPRPHTAMSWPQARGSGVICSWRACSKVQKQWDGYGGWGDEWEGWGCSGCGCSIKSFILYKQCCGAEFMDKGGAGAPPTHIPISLSLDWAACKIFATNGWPLTPLQFQHSGFCRLCFNFRRFFSINVGCKRVNIYLSGLCFIRVYAAFGFCFVRKMSPQLHVAVGLMSFGLMTMSHLGLCCLY